MANQKVMSQKEKQTRIILASIIGVVFIGLFVFSKYGDTPNNREEKRIEQEISNKNTESSTEQNTVDEDVCSKCGGTGYVPTYSIEGCRHPAHFSVGDCTSDHHSAECISSGSKTCPCCNGTGKSH